MERKSLETCDDKFRSQKLSWAKFAQQMSKQIRKIGNRIDRIVNYRPDRLIQRHRLFRVTIRLQWQFFGPKKDLLIVKIIGYSDNLLQWHFSGNPQSQIPGMSSSGGWQNAYSACEQRHRVLMELTEARSRMSHASHRFREKNGELEAAALEYR